MITPSAGTKYSSQTTASATNMYANPQMCSSTAPRRLCDIVNKSLGNTLPCVVPRDLFVAKNKFSIAVTTVRLCTFLAFYRYSDVYVFVGVVCVINDLEQPPCSEQTRHANFKGNHAVASLNRAVVLQECEVVVFRIRTTKHLHDLVLLQCFVQLLNLSVKRCLGDCYAYPFYCRDRCISPYAIHSCNLTVKYHSSAAYDEHRIDQEKNKPSGRQVPYKGFK